VKSNDIATGDATTGDAWGIAVGSAMAIDSNRINADQSTVGACSASAPCGGIASFSSAATITNNVVFGAKSTTSAALLLAESEAPAQVVPVNANYLDGGGLAALTASTVSTAVMLRNCGASACGTNTFLGKLRNNVLAGGRNATRHGIFEVHTNGRAIHPQALDNNDFFTAASAGHTDVLYHFWNGTTATDYNTIAAVQANVPAGSTPSANFSADCLFNSSFHLPGGSPCISAGTATEAPAADFDGESRPFGPGVDVGPDEVH
jgi:hypothetical protein